MIVQAISVAQAPCSAVCFSVIAEAAWAPGIETREAWKAWARDGFRIAGSSEPGLRAMPAMQRRRVGFLGRMALEVAYTCLGERRNVPVVFCSRHGEVSRSVDMLQDLARGVPLSPASFGLSVHNATAGMFAIARGDMANHLALSAGADSVETAVVEACGLLADGEKAVLLVVYDCPLPAIYADQQDCDEQPFAWAWLIGPPEENAMSLSWSPADKMHEADDTMPAGLQVLRFHLGTDRDFSRFCGNRKWHWSRHA